MFKKFLIQVHETPYILASAVTFNPLSLKPLISSSLSSSFDLPSTPLGLPSLKPFDFFKANASLVLLEIRSLSISDTRANIVDRTLDSIVLPLTSLFSLHPNILIPFSEESFSISKISRMLVFPCVIYIFLYSKF